MSEMMVSIAGLILIALVAWWFWFSTPQAAHTEADTSVEIQVKDGTYQPAAVEVVAGQPLSLRFVRHDATPCAEKVVFISLGISAELPLGRMQDIHLPALKPGMYEFTCQMGMYRGRLIAK
jgi:plastocyanin domain-containing protein